MSRFMIARRGGFTVFEIIVIVVAVFLLVTMIGLATGVVKVEIEGTWSSAPAVIPAGVSTDFVYSVTQKRGGGTAAALAGRVVNFRVMPGGTVITLAPATGTTDVNGQITVRVTPHSDYRGGANLWAEDAKSGTEDPPQPFTVQ
jgi:hypothetical protein